MWSLRQKDSGDFYLTYDRQRWFTNNLRGLWELVGPQNSAYARFAADVNRKAGLLCCDDDEGNIRVLVLEN